MKFFKVLFFLIGIPFLIFSDAHYEVFVDPYFSPYMGSESIITLHKSLEKKEDSLIKPTEPPRVGILPGIGRAAELGLFWLPINSFGSVVQHEVFGHGFYIRSIDARVKGYSFDWPQPYGSGGAATSWAPNYSTTVGQLQAVNIGGVEAEMILARQLKLKWLADRKVNPREESMYWLSQLSSLAYSLVPSETLEIECDEEKSEQDAFLDLVFNPHDIEAYIFLLNIMYPDDYLNIETLRGTLKLNWLDPMIYYSMASAWYYIFTGKSLYIPMIKVGSVSFLPNISIQLAPYGLEYYLENYLIYKDSPIYTYIKGGKHSQMEYFGCGVHYDEILKGSDISMGLRFDAWYQPNFLSNWTLEEFAEKMRPIRTLTGVLKRKPGMSVSIVSRYCIRDTLTFFYSDIGYKSKGYLPGFTLNASPTIRLGISSQF